MTRICTKKETCISASRAILVRDPNISFCPECGSALQTADETVINLPKPVPSGTRLAGWLIDFLITVLVAAISLIPVIGQLITSILLSLFWLLRDINGRSPGKMALGLDIVDSSGGPSTTKQRIIRNLPLSLPLLSLMVPFLGYVAVAVLGPLALVIETILIITTGQRIGDRLAGTVVVRRAPAVLAARA
jgi:uncharacterized RDD family membrane protein YckC